MNRLFIALALTISSLGLNCPVLAQWDLGGTVNPMQSGGGGNTMSVQPYSLNPNGTFGQPYLFEPSYIKPSQSPTIYNQRGVIENNNPVSNIPSQYMSTLGSPRVLSTTNTPQLSPMQNNGYYSNIPKGVPTRNGLPITTLDSFVKTAGGAASHIYGDEGTNSWSPMSSFTEADTINAGIVGTNNQTLTTGHGSWMPTASGNGMTESGPRTIRVRQVRAKTRASQTE